ncbi:MAG: universal stress protein [Verrucomicrobiota bacterium]|nr:universal stress protein [Verrucomicrobiota bacterium]
MKKILFAYDGTPGAILAMRGTVRAGLPISVEARVLTIADVWLPPIAPVADPLAMQPSLVVARENAESILREARERATEGAHLLHELFPSWTITSSAIPDSPTWAITAEARRWGADMIVVGSHGRSSLERFFLGSVSYKVAAEASCSVRIVRPADRPEHRGVRVMIAVDGSEDGQRAVEEALERRWSSRAELHLVTVIDPKVKGSVAGKHFEFGQGLDRVEDSLKPMLDSLAAKFEENEMEVYIHILEGDPKHALLRHAEVHDVDVIFLGARGLDHGKRLYLGTLASAICTRAHCTVEVVRSAQHG